jgi:hypothetical protein
MASGHLGGPWVGEWSFGVFCAGGGEIKVVCGVRCMTGEVQGSVCGCNKRLDGLGSQRKPCKCVVILLTDCQLKCTGCAGQCEASHQLWELPCGVCCTVLDVLPQIVYETVDGETAAGADPPAEPRLTFFIDGAHTPESMATWLVGVLRESEWCGGVQLYFMRFKPRCSCDRPKLAAH